jgi:hypothetical protein
MRRWLSNANPPQWGAALAEPISSGGEGRVLKNALPRTAPGMTMRFEIHNQEPHRHTSCLLRFYEFLRRTILLGGFSLVGHIREAD